MTKSKKRSPLKSPFKLGNVIDRPETVAEISRLYRRGWSQLDIAVKYGVSQPTISQALKTEREAAKKQVAKTREAEQQQVIAALMEIIRECWDAWEHSKKPGEEITEKKRVDDGEDGDGTEFTLVELVTTGRCPDSDYLRLAKECWDKICTIRGLEAPKEMSLTARISPVTHELRALLDAAEDQRGCRKIDHVLTIDVPAAVPGNEVPCYTDDEVPNEP